MSGAGAFACQLILVDPSGYVLWMIRDMFREAESMRVPVGGAA